MNNMCEKTGIRYGAIRSDMLDSDLVQELLYGSQAKDLTYEQAVQDETARQRTEWEMQMESACIAYQESDPDNLRRGSPWEPFENFEPDLENFDPQIEEPVHEGRYEEVFYRSFWLGGALHFWIIESPMVGHFELCSPCLPGCGDLHNRTARDKGHLTFDVPPGWRYVDPPDGKSFADRLGEHE